MALSRWAADVYITEVAAYTTLMFSRVLFENFHEVVHNGERRYHDE